MIDYAKSIKDLKAGKTYFSSVGQAGYIVKSSNGQILGIDLCLTDFTEKFEKTLAFKRMLPKILDADELEFDVLISTHFHADHLDMDAILDLLNHTKVFVASTGCEEYVSDISKDITAVCEYVEVGHEKQYGDFLVKTVYCDHGTAAPDAFGVIVSVDGKNILFLGDTCIHLEKKDEFIQNGPIDVLVGPINGRFGNINEEEFAEYCGVLCPALAIPSHYGMFPGHGGSPEKYMEIMKEAYPEIDFNIMYQGEIIEL